jgi:hypothetical protein
MRRIKEFSCLFPFFLGVIYALEVFGTPENMLALPAIVGLAKQLALFGEPYFLKSLGQGVLNSIAGLIVAAAVAISYSLESATVSALAMLGVSPSVSSSIHKTVIMLAALANFYQISDFLTAKTSRKVAVRFLSRCVLFYYPLITHIILQKIEVTEVDSPSSSPSSPVRAAQISSEKYQEEGKEYTRKNLELLKKFLEENPEAAANASYKRTDLLKKLDDSIRSLVSPMKKH